MFYSKSFLPILLALVSITVIPVNAQYSYLSAVPEMKIPEMRNRFNSANLSAMMKKQAEMTWVEQAWYQSVAGGANYYIWAYYRVDGFYEERRCYMGGFRSHQDVYTVKWIACSYKPISARSRKRSKYELFPKKSKKNHHKKKHHKDNKHNRHDEPCKHHSHSSHSSSSSSS